MNKIEYKKILDAIWSLRCAELRAKTEWDSVVKYGKDDLLYELNYEKVKELRIAQKTLNEMVQLLSENDQLQYSE